MNTIKNLKDKIIVDMWFLMFGILVAPASIVPIVPLSRTGSAISIVAIIGAFAFLLFCSKLHKYRYLHVYTNCKKTPTWVMYGLGILYLVAAIMFRFWEHGWLLLYILVLMILSIQFEEKEHESRE